MRKLETLVFDTLKIENCSNNTQSLSLAGSETITSFNFVIEFTKRMAYCLNTLIALNFNKKKNSKKKSKKRKINLADLH